MLQYKLVKGDPDQLDAFEKEVNEALAGAEGADLKSIISVKTGNKVTLIALIPYTAKNSHKPVGLRPDSGGK